MIRRIFQGRRAIPPFLSYMIVFIVTFAASCTSLMAEEEEWRFVYEAGDITVHKRAKEGSSFLEFKAIGDLRGKIADYMNVLVDTDRMPDWAPQCFEAKNLEVINDKEVIIYVACNGIWPVADRDYTAKRTVISDPQKSTVRISIDLTDNPNVPNSNKRIHIRHLQCYWLLKQIDPTYTHVELHAFVDPGGRVPSWLVNWGYRYIPYKYLKNLEKEIIVGSIERNAQFTTVSASLPLKK